MDQSLSSLYPIHQIGSDGFSWWIGQVETNKKDDPKRSGRYRVRIIGQHLKTGDNATSTDELPWAHTMMPVTVPYVEGGSSGASPGLQRGCFVVGFYLDNDKQKPIIMGSIGGVKSSTKEQNEDDTGSGPLNFKAVKSPEVNPKQDRSNDTQSGKDANGGNTDKGVVDADRADQPNGAPPAVLAAYANHTETNPTGGKSCVVIANPNCGQEKNLKSGLTRILGDLLAANQASGGNIGDFYVSKINGLLYNSTSQARYHIGRVVRLAKSFIARGKTEITKQLRGAVDFLNQSLLTTTTVVGNTGPLADPDKAFKPITEKSNKLKKVKEVFDSIFKDLGCSIADMTDRIAKFITDLIFGYLSDVFSAAACFVDTLIDGILNEILAQFDSLVQQVLAPIQAVLDAIAAPLNLIGGIVNKFMKLLGISCTGPDAKCEPIQQKCTDCGGDDDGDSLDDLLKAIEAGVGDSSLVVCNEAKQTPAPSTTAVTFIGGVPDDPTIPDENEIPSGEEVIDFTIPPVDTDEPPVLPPPGEDEEFGDPIPVEDEDDDDGIPNLPDDGTPEIEIYTDQVLYKEGDTITYNIISVAVPNGTVFNYELSGPTITEGDISGPLTGQFTISGNAATVDVTLAVDEEIELSPELLIFDCNSASPVIITDDEGNQDSFDLVASHDVIIDSQITAPVEPDPTQTEVWGITTDKTAYQEGEDVLVTVTATNVPDDTEVTYYLVGIGVDANDFVSRSLSGTINIKNGLAAFVLSIEDDVDTEGQEIVDIILSGKGVNTRFTINEDAEGGNNETDDTVTQEEFTIKKPVAGAPITDESGSIVEIPITRPGGPYQTPPQVIITGAGYGAGAQALLNDKGFVTEIRVTRQGINYVANTADDNNLSCIADSFTMISPGSGYTFTPTVLVNGERDVAEAIIDDRGFVMSVRTLDRNRRYKSMPTVTIIGGGGGGAKFLPSMVCLDSNELERRGYAKIGTGSYIDCP